MSQTCPKCGTSVIDGSKFCPKCGTDVTTPATAAAQAAAMTSQNYVSSTGAQGFVNSSEGGSFSLKNGRMMNVVSGEGFVKEDAILTNRRLYYSAKFGLIDTHSTEEVVDINDITGTKITDYKPFSFFIYAAIAIIVGIVADQFLAFSLTAAIFVILFFVLKKSHLRIEYAGGNINFSVKKYGLKNVRAFQRQIYIEKEKIKAEERGQ